MTRRTPQFLVVLGLIRSLACSVVLGPCSNRWSSPLCTSDIHAVAGLSIILIISSTSLVWPLDCTGVSLFFDCAAFFADPKMIVSCLQVWLYFRKYGTKDSWIMRTAVRFVLPSVPCSGCIWLMVACILKGGVGHDIRYMSTGHELRSVRPPFFG